MTYNANPGITAYRRRNLLKLVVPSIVWCILVSVFEIVLFYDYILQNLGAVTAVGLWILLSLIVPIHLGLVKYRYRCFIETSVEEMRKTS